MSVRHFTEIQLVLAVLFVVKLKRNLKLVLKCAVILKIRTTNTNSTHL